MRTITVEVIKLLVAGATCVACIAPVRAQDAPPPAEPELFAVEIKVGPKWDAAKPAHEQALFREHSANLRELREAGSLVLGARYSDKGLLVLRAPSLADARAMMDRDPSIVAGVFGYDIHPLNVFYPGTVQSRPRRTGRRRRSCRVKRRCTGGLAMVASRR
jgi:uncharacterized protein YciI